MLPENVCLQMTGSKRNPVVHVNYLKRDKSDPVNKMKPFFFVKVLDKMRTRNDKGGLETRHFVELDDGTTLWCADEGVLEGLLEEKLSLKDMFAAEQNLV